MRPDHADARNPLYRIVAVDFWRAGQMEDAMKTCTHNSSELPNFQLSPAQCLSCQAGNGGAELPQAEPCRLHKDDPASCPQAHRCVCGALLAEHRTVEARCPNRNAGRFRSDAATLKRFPEQYRY